MDSEGKYSLKNGGGWTDGFYIGVLNLAYFLSGDEEFRKFASVYDDFLKKRIENTDEIKIFVWEDLETATPVCKSKSILVE